MDKKTKTMLVLSIVFACITAFFLFLTTFTTVSTYKTLLNPDGNVGDVVGGFFIYVLAFLYAFGTIVFGVMVLPFNIILIKKCNYKNTGSIAILVFAIVAMVVALGLAISVPVVAGIQSSASDAASSSSVASVSL